LSKLSKYATKDQLVREGLDELDVNAKSELDGTDDDLDDDLDDAELEIESGIEDQQEMKNDNDNYGIKNISDQLNGMVEHWFKLTQSVSPEKKESFLKLGDRLSELSDILQSEFMDG